MEIVLTIAMFLFYLLQVILAIYLVLPFLLLSLHFIVKAAGRNSLEKKYPIANEKKFDFAAIVTAHRDTRFILPLVDSFCKQNYQNFIVYVVADDCDTSNLYFKDERIRILKPEVALNAKIQSIKYAVDHFIRPHDVLVVFDSDNLVHPSYFQNLNHYFQRGFRAVQTHMLSKNIDTVFSKLDSIGHIYNTFIERQSKMELGLSSSILGLGIAIEVDLYHQVMYKDGLGGFDKKLQADIIEIIPQLGFAEDAIVYDEKVDDGSTLEKQRTRWIYTYFKYFQIHWQLFIKGIRRLNFNLFFFGFNLLRPPLFITITIAFIIMILNFFIMPAYAFVWAGLLFLFAVSFVIIVLTQSRQPGMHKAFLYIPILVFRQLKALLKIKKAKKTFLKTEHVRIIYIEELLKNETL